MTKEILSGIYVERDYSWDEISVEHIAALARLGCRAIWNYEQRMIRIEDTSKQVHERCGEPLDSLEMIG